MRALDTLEKSITRIAVRGAAKKILPNSISELMRRYPPAYGSAVWISLIAYPALETSSREAGLGPVPGDFQPLLAALAYSGSRHLQTGILAGVAFELSEKCERHAG